MLKNPGKVVQRIKENQIKLYTNNLPNLILGNAQSLYKIEGNGLFYKNIFYLFVLLIPIFLLFYGIFTLLKKGQNYFVFSFLSFFATASIFFTLFFVLDRYFVIFVPLFIFFIVYGLENIIIKNIYLEVTKYIIGAGILVGIYSLGILSYYNTFKSEDSKYEVKKIAGEWLKQNDFRTNLKVMERFPVVTYYSGSKERWLTPYTNSLENLIIYAKFNDINYLVVDSVDFLKYRPDIDYLYNEPNKKYNGLDNIKTFEKNSEKVILYRIK